MLQRATRIALRQGGWVGVPDVLAQGSADLVPRKIASKVLVWSKPLCLFTERISDFNIWQLHGARNCYVREQNAEVTGPNETVPVRRHPP